MQRFDRDSEVFKMIQENKESRTAPRQSNTFKMLQEVLEADEKGETSCLTTRFFSQRIKSGPLSVVRGQETAKILSTY